MWVVAIIGAFTAIFATAKSAATGNASAAMNSDIAVRWNSAGICGRFSGSTCPPTRPASRLPSADAMNQTPII